LPATITKFGEQKMAQIESFAH